MKKKGKLTDTLTDQQLGALIGQMGNLSNRQLKAILRTSGVAESKLAAYPDDAGPWEPRRKRAAKLMGKAKRKVASGEV